MLSRKKPYQDLGYGYLDERKRGTTANRLVRRLEGLGYRVTLQTEPKAALAGSAAG